MSNTRDFKSLGIIADNSEPITDTNPVREQGIAYRNTSINDQVMEEGVVYDRLSRSDNTNQKLWGMSQFTDQIDQKGILYWSDLVDYDKPSIVLANDGNIYFAVSPSGPNNGGFIDPSSSVDVSNWWDFIDSAYNLNLVFSDEVQGEEGARLIGYDNTPSYLKETLDRAYRTTNNPIDLLSYGRIKGKLNIFGNIIEPFEPYNAYNYSHLSLINYATGGPSPDYSGYQGLRIFFSTELEVSEYIVHIYPSTALVPDPDVGAPIPVYGYAYSFGNRTTTYFDLFARGNMSAFIERGYNWFTVWTGETQEMGRFKGLTFDFNFIVYKLGV